MGKDRNDVREQHAYSIGFVCANLIVRVWSNLQNVEFDRRVQASKGALMGVIYEISLFFDQAGNQRLSCNKSNAVIAPYFFV
jgi:hypothetical protein